MSAKRTAMRKLREVLRLSFSAGLAIRQISASTKISVGSIQNILKLAEQLSACFKSQSQSRPNIKFIIAM